MRLKLLTAVLLGILVFLQYRLWFQPGGIPQLLALRKILVQKRLENEEIKKRNEELLFQIERIQNGHDETESRARNEIGMIKKGETFYQIVRKDQ